MKRSEFDADAELAALRKIEANRRCFDCGERGTTYVVAEVGVFVCSVCAGLHREFNHRAKGLSTSIFKQDEVENLKAKGNEWAAKVWLGRYNPKEFPAPSPKDTFRVKEFMRLKYKDRRFYQDPGEAEPARQEEVKVPSPAATAVAPPAPAVSAPAPVATPPTSAPPAVTQAAPAVNLLEWDEPAPVQTTPPATQAAPSTTPQVPLPTENWAAFPTEAPANPPPAAAQNTGTGSLLTDLSFPAATPQPLTDPTPVATPEPAAPVKLPENASMFLMKENTHPAPTAQPVMAPAQPNLGSLGKLVEDDPFSSLQAPGQPRAQPGIPGMSPGMPQGGVNMAAMQQQYMAQAAMYQQMHGVPYPYPFQQWMQIMNPTPGGMPGMPQPGMMTSPGMMQQPGMSQPGMMPPSGIMPQPGMSQPGMMPQPGGMNIGGPQGNIASPVAQQENALFSDLVKTDMSVANTLPNTAPMMKPTATLASTNPTQPSLSMPAAPPVQQKNSNNPFDF